MTRFGETSEIRRLRRRGGGGGERGDLMMKIGEGRSVTSAHERYRRECCVCIYIIYISADGGMYEWIQRA